MHTRGAFQKVQNSHWTKCIEICQSEDSTRRQVEALRPDLKKTVSAPPTEVHRLGHQGRSFTNNGQPYNQSAQTSFQQRRQSCYCCGASPSHPKSKCPAKDAVCRGCNKTGHYEKVCRSKKYVKHLDAQQPQTTHEVYLPSQETEYTTPYFQSKSETGTRAPVNMLTTVPVSRLHAPAAPHQEHIRPLWISQSQNSQITR